MDENTRAGQTVGSPISATDNDRRQADLHPRGPQQEPRSPSSTSDPARYGRGAPLDHEERSSYSVTVKVNDGQRQSNSEAAKSVTISSRWTVDEIAVRA